MLVCYNISLQAINVTIKISNFDINNKRSEKLLGIKFNQKPIFDVQISDLWKKITRKIHALRKITP